MNLNINSKGEISIPLNLLKKLKINKDTNLNIKIYKGKILIYKLNKNNFKNFLNKIQGVCFYNEISTNDILYMTRHFPHNE